MAAVNDPKDKKFYVYNPNLNTQCGKQDCAYLKLLGQCRYTTEKEYSVDGIAYSAEELWQKENKGH